MSSESVPLASRIEPSFLKYEKIMIDFLIIRLKRTRYQAYFTISDHLWSGRPFCRMCAIFKARVDELIVFINNVN